MRNVIRKRKNSGQSVVEFALMMPIIMAMFFYVFQAILTGKVFEGARVTADGNDGVKAELGEMASLPYAWQLLNFTNEVPTHLGQNEWQGWSSLRESEGTNLMYTDNNLRDN